MRCQIELLAQRLATLPGEEKAAMECLLPALDHLFFGREELPFAAD